ncbi:MAG: hypothetical protein ACTTH8_01955 [Treponema sp.]
MDNLKKTLAEEKKVYKELLANLDICYSECGEALFKYRQESPDNAAVYDVDGCFEKWQSARESRDKNTQTIITIKAAVTRQNELKKFIAEVDKVLYEYTAERKKAASAFSVLFFQEYYDVYPQYFSDISKDIEPLQAQIKNFEQERTDLETQKNTANFLQKLSIGTQLTVLKAKNMSAQKKIEKAVTIISESLLQNPQVVNLYTDKQLQDSLNPLYEQFYEYTDKIAEAENRKTALIEENTAVEAELVACGVSDNPQYRINELTQYIKDIDASINTLEKDHGINLFRIFYPNADALHRAVPQDTEVQLPADKNIQACIETIREQCITLQKQQNSITVLENELAINEETARIQNLQKAIVHYEQNITDYQRMIEKAQSDIVQAEDKKHRLQSANEALKSDVP